VRRMVQAGITPVTWIAVAAEWQRDWHARPPPDRLRGPGPARGSHGGRAQLGTTVARKQVTLDSAEEERSLMNNEQIVRRAYAVAEKVDIPGWVDCFTPDGTFTDMSINVTFRGPDGRRGLGYIAENFARRSRTCIASCSGSSRWATTTSSWSSPSRDAQGPLELPEGTLPATGKRMNAPCCDVFRIVNGKIQSFNCYPSATVIMEQLGVLMNLEASFSGK